MSINVQHIVGSFRIARHPGLSIVWSLRFDIPHNIPILSRSFRFIKFEMGTQGKRSGSYCSGNTFMNAAYALF